MPHTSQPSSRSSKQPYRVVSGDLRCVLGEGPLWLPELRELFWVDILSAAVFRLQVASGALRRWAVPDYIGWLIPRLGSKGFIAGMRGGFAEISFDPMSIRRLEEFPDHRANQRMRMNDGKADRRGRIFAGSMDMDGRQAGNLYCLDGDSWTIVDDGYGIPNGPAFSPTGDVMYHTDSKLGLVYRFDILEDGTLANKQPLLKFPEDWGVPDGMTTDTDGGLWVAHWGGSRVSRFTPAGVLDRCIHLPTSQITSCAFGGPDLKSLYVTSAGLGRPEDSLAGAVFEVDSGCQGLPVDSFSG